MPFLINQSIHKLTVQSHYAESFTRLMTTSEADWLNRLPAAVAPHRIARSSAGEIEIAIAASGTDRGTLIITWKDAPPFGASLIKLPRLEATFRFSALSEWARTQFMQKFDLYMHRGGG
jgi:hypothetical protein